jgi:cytochrome c553
VDGQVTTSIVAARFMLVPQCVVMPANMAGQSAFAIYKQLDDFKSGARSNGLMAGVVQSLTDDQMADAAAHFAALSRGPWIRRP